MQTTGSEWLARSSIFFSPNNTGLGLAQLLENTLVKIEIAAAATGSCTLQQAAANFMLSGYERPWYTWRPLHHGHVPLIWNTNAQSQQSQPDSDNEH